MTTTSDITTAAATLGRKGGIAKSTVKTAAVRENARLGGRPSSTVTYTVREPGCSYWWQGNRKGEARKALRSAHAAGLSRATIYVERDGEISELAE